MEDISFVTAHLIVFCVAYMLLRLSRIELLKISIPLVVFIAFVMCDYIGLLIIYFSKAEYFIDTQMNQEEKFALLYYSSVSLLMIVLGFYIASWKRKFNPALKEAVTEGLSHKGVIVVIGLFMVCCLMLLLYLRNRQQVPLMVAILGDNVEASRLRVATMTDNVLRGPLKSHHYRLFTFFIMSFLTYLVFAHALISRTKASRYLMITVFCVAVFASVVDVGKGQFMLLIIGLYMTYLITKNERIKLKPVIFLSIISVFILILMTKSFMAVAPDIEMSGTVWGILRRITTGSLIPAYYCLGMFKGVIFFMGAHFQIHMGYFHFHGNLMISM